MLQFKNQKKNLKAAANTAARLSGHLVTNTWEFMERFACFLAVWISGRLHPVRHNVYLRDSHTALTLRHPECDRCVWEQVVRLPNTWTSLWKYKMLPAGRVHVILKHVNRIVSDGHEKKQPGPQATNVYHMFLSEVLSVSSGIFSRFGASSACTFIGSVHPLSVDRTAWLSCTHQLDRISSTLDSASRSSLLLPAHTRMHSRSGTMLLITNSIQTLNYCVLVFIASQRLTVEPDGSIFVDVCTCKLVHTTSFAHLMSTEWAKQMISSASKTEQTWQ